MLIIRKSEQTQTAAVNPERTTPPLTPQPLSSYEEQELASESMPTSPKKSTATKRAADDTRATKNVKRSKKNAAQKKHNCFHRMWSEEDEIVILKGLMDYSSDPILDLDGFYDFIKKKVHVDASRVQLFDKVRSLRRKYKREKSTRGGKERSGHDQKVFDLAETIWGDNGTGTVIRRSASAKVNESEEVKKNAVVESGDEAKVMSAEERVLMGGRVLFQVGGEGGEEWRKLRVEELELYQKEMELKAAQMKLRAAQTKLVLDAIKKGNIPSF